MAEFNKKATIGAIPNSILASKSDPLHILQMLKKLNPILTAGFGDSELLKQVQKLEQRVQNVLL